MAVKALEVRALEVPANSAVEFGAEILNADVENLSDEAFAVIHDTLYNNAVVVIKNQAGVSPVSYSEKNALRLKTSRE